MVDSIFNLNESKKLISQLMNKKFQELNCKRTFAINLKKIYSFKYYLIVFFDHINRIINIQRTKLYLR